MRNWQVIFYIRRDNSFDFPVGSPVGATVAISSFVRAARLRERRFIMVISFRGTRRWYPQSAFDSHWNKLESDSPAGEGKRKREKRRQVAAGKKARTHVDITERRLSGISAATTSVQIDVLAKRNRLRNFAEFHRKNSAS